MEKVIFLVLLAAIVEAYGTSENEYQPSVYPLHVLVFNPHPDPSGKVVWPGGPSLFSAAQLAADMINNRTDILPTYSLQLVDGDSGCVIRQRATYTFVQEVYHRNDIIGVLGPACSIAATEIGELVGHPNIHLVAITIANGLQLKNKYHNMLRMISSTTLYSQALFKLMQFNGWKNSAVIYNLQQGYFVSAYSSFVNTVSAEYNLYQLAVEGNTFPLDFIHNKVNAIFVFADSVYIKHLLCLAFQSKWSLIYPNYQWIFLETHENVFLDDVEFSYDGQTYSCSKEDMIVASNRTIILRFRLQKENKTDPTDVGLTYNEFFRLYESYLSDYLNKTNTAREDVTKDADDWAATYFDSMWALGLALNRSDAIFRNRNMSLRDYHYDNPAFTSLIREQLLVSTNFEGLSGNIYFHNDSLEVPSVVDIFQTNPKYIGLNFRIGYYYEEDLIISDSKNASFVSATRKELKIVSTMAVAIFFPLALLLLFLIILLHIVYCVFRKSKPIKAQSPNFSNFIFSGCYLLILSAILETVKAANWTGIEDVDSSTFRILMGSICNLIMWSLTLGTCLIFGTVCALSWRLYRIFQKFSDPGSFISDPFLVLIIIGLITVNFILLIVWSSQDPLLLEILLGDEAIHEGIISVYSYCDCTYFNTWLIIWGWNGAIIVLVIVLALLNRHVQREYFSNTRTHSLMVYAVALLNGICVPLYYVQLHNFNINYPFIIFMFFTLGSAMLASFFLFVPPVLPILRKELFLKRNPFF